MSERKTALEVLKAARELISDEKRWTRHAHARDARLAQIHARLHAQGLIVGWRDEP